MWLPPVRGSAQAEQAVQRERVLIEHRNRVALRHRKACDAFTDAAGTEESTRKLQGLIEFTSAIINGTVLNQDEIDRVLKG